ncbi:ATP-binding protein [Massilia sp. W12]|uniref:ATP-binding protein n=1 Tax=Massilia sp. W12 TaxID=3126507 RepID=UPI0030CF2521
MDAVPHLFANRESIANLEKAIQAHAVTAEGTPLRLHLAWYVRQSDRARARELLQSMEFASGVARRTRELAQARSHLIQAEWHWLDGQQEAGIGLAQQIWRQAQDWQDDALSADACLLLCWLYFSEGDEVNCRQHLMRMKEVAQDNPERSAVAHALLARLQSRSDCQRAASEWQRWQEQAPAPLPQAACVTVNCLNGMLAHGQNEDAQAVRHFALAWQQALECGQICEAIYAASCVGDSFNQLNEYHAALEWMQRSLQLARQHAWPGPLAISLIQSANTLRLQQEHEAARKLLLEALHLLGPLGKGYYHALASMYLAQSRLDCGEYMQALHTLQEPEPRRKALGGDLLSWALRAQAQALARLGQEEQALQVAQRALQTAHKLIEEKIPALCVLASLHREFAHLPPPPECAAPRAALHYLLQALELARGMEGYRIPAELHQMLAGEYASLEQHALAYQHALAALHAREQIHTRAADKRALALQLNHETEKLRLEAEARRAELLQETNETLELLGGIGQQITLHLQAEDVYAALHYHLHDLLQVDSFAIWLLDKSGLLLKRVFCIEFDERLDGAEVPLSQLQEALVRCVRERRELRDCRADSARRAAHAREAMDSSLFMPLLLEHQVLGAMSLQCQPPHAYGTRELMIARNLAAYAAIALDNCAAHAELAQAHTELADAHLDLDRAHRHLQDTQQQLAQQEKMATLGQLITSIAHELNTPTSAMKSASQSIADLLRHALDELPRLLLSMNEAERSLFARLLRHAGAPLDSRSERQLARQLQQDLQEAGVANARHKAGVLAQLQAQGDWHACLPLLLRVDADHILHLAQQLGSVLASAGAIRHAVNNVSKVVFALRSLVQAPGEAELQRVRLPESLETVLTLYQSKLQQGVRLKRQYEQNLPLLLCRPHDLQQVWMNLIQNALQAMQYQGELTLSVSRQEQELVVAIIDSGCGIAADLQERIFERFFTTRAVGEGSGLGLTIARQIVQQHRGRIHCHSIAGCGSSFFVHLPLETRGAR